jgi:Cd2+/Zn2+-exporting ATPase
MTSRNSPPPILSDAAPQTAIADESSLRQETVAVRGMDCSSCASGVEKAVRKLPGVREVSVNYAVERMKVQYDESLTDHLKIADTIRSLGYRMENVNHAPGNDSSRNGGPSTDSCCDPSAGNSIQTEHSHENHDHAHSASPAARLLPARLRRYADFALSIIAGLLLLTGWCGERFFGLPHGAAIALYAGAYLCSGWHITRNGIASALRGYLDIDFLMVVAAAGAAFLGDWAEGAFLLFLFSFSHALEHAAMERARDAIHALKRLAPRTAQVRRTNDRGIQTESEISVDDLRVGDIAIVRPGDRVAVEGLVLKGSSAVDESPITGESVPVEKELGDTVFAGAINGEGALEVTVQRLAHDTTLARVVQMVEEAQSEKSHVQTFAETFERKFVPTVLITVILAAIVPPLAGWLTWNEAILRALSALVAASPCALALATPAAMLAGIARAAQNGVLIKGGAHLENLASIKAIAFDKTGTLTRGRPELVAIVSRDTLSSVPSLAAPSLADSSLSADILSTGQTELLRLAAAAETRSSHTLAHAVVQRARALHLSLPEIFDLQSLTGRGVQGEIEDEIVRIGNARLFSENDIELSAQWQNAIQQLSEQGMPTMIVARGQQIMGVLGFADQMRDETPAALAKLRTMGINTLVMLTGDNTRVASRIAASAGVTEVRAELLPADKVSVLRDLLKSHRNVAMVGDGVNDAPALAHATVGIAMGAAGTDVALETADVALMADDLSKLPFAVALARQTSRIVRQNLWISLGVIAVVAPAALLGFTRLGIAIVFHEGSTLIVVANALRLLRFRFDHN